MSRDTAAESVPRRIGRYEIVGPLAAGGMAEILLGRLVGPSGFQRAVVIKRILRHLARKKDFVDMFLDEARIVASIRHPNVVHVHELGHEDEELFLVMEYLEGESTAGLMRRLVATGESLDFALCCYIVAEACSGVHAAHELADGSGKNLGVVHRDVTPHNVFINYGGGIKVLDFGIATASEESGRLHQTEAGQFKGKLEYASPEQCRGKTLDRRSDIFSLGTILWELTTGMRLFKRPSALDMAKAICEKPIPKPTSIVKDYPPELEAIVMKALARARKDRYQNALELRRDLLGQMRKLTTSVGLDEELVTLMRRLFADRIAEKAEMLRTMEAGDSVANIPAGDADAEVQIPVAGQEDDARELTETDSEADSHADADTDPRQVGPVDLPISSQRAGAAGGERKQQTLPTIPRETKGQTRKMGADEIQQAMELAAAERERKARAATMAATAATEDASTATGTGTGTGTGTTAGVATPGEAFRPAQLSPRVPRIVMIAGALFAVIGIVLIAFSFGVRTVSQKDEDAAPSSASPPASTVALGGGDTPATPAPTGSDDPAPMPTPAPGVELTTVHIETVPPKAAVYVNGVKRGVSPLDIKVAKSAAALNVEVRQAGFVVVKERVIPDANQKLRITLVPVAGGAQSGNPYHRFD